jgi:hypothetical protein
MLSWESWLLEQISLDGSISYISSRQHVIREFCIKGLYPFIKSKGYAWRINQETLTAKVLRLMYFAYRKKKVYVEEYNWDWDPEHKLMYWHVLDTDTWDTLWEKWGSIEGFTLHYSLPFYVWNWLDLEKSPRAIKLERDLYDPDEVHVEVRKEKEDPYLQDLMVGTTIYDKHRL